jgi:hypothetical protein
MFSTVKKVTLHKRKGIRVPDLHTLAPEPSKLQRNLKLFGYGTTRQ